MDDHGRLLRLISLVAWTEDGTNGGRCGLSFADTDYERWWKAGTTACVVGLERPEDPALPGLDDATWMALWNMCTWYAGAIKHLRDPQTGATDARQLPEFVLEAVSRLPDDVLARLGAMICCSLGLSERADETQLAIWVDEVAATSWRLLLEARQDRFGQ
jgi:hypothetical protein